MDILITGAGRGIGYLTAGKLADMGHRVFAGVRDPDKATEQLAALSGDVIPISLNLLDRTTIAPAVEAVMSHTSQLDGLVNNAGISNLGPLEDQHNDEFERIMETNFFGHYHLTRAVLPRMRTQRSGRIVMVSSLSGLFGLPGETAYCCSKFAMEAMAECLRFEVAPFGIGVSVINPSYTQTELAASTDLHRATPEDSPYLKQMQGLLQVQQAGEEAGDDASVVADAVVHALTAISPQFRYVPGSAAELYAAWKNASDEEFYALVQQSLGTRLY